MHGRARVPALPPSGEIDNGRTEAALVSQSGNSNCHKSCLLKDGGRRPAFTGSDAADEWATSEVSRSGCPLADETLAQMSARAADRIWSQRGAGRFAGEKLEAVIGVEPMMEVLQTSVSRAQQWSTRRSCAAQSKVLGWLGVGSYPGVMSRGEASCRQCVGRLVLGWARTSVLRRAVTRTATRSDRIGRPSRSRTPHRTSCRSPTEGRAVSHTPQLPGRRSPRP